MHSRHTAILAALIASLRVIPMVLGNSTDYTAAYDVDINTVALYHLDGDAADAVGNHDGTVAGDAGFAAGKFGQCLSLDGNGDYVRIGNVHQAPPRLPILGTVELWFKLDSAPAYFALAALGQEYGGHWDDGFFVGRHSEYSNNLVFMMWAGGWVVADSGLAPESLVGAWHHVAGTWGPEGMKLWLDGQLVGTNEFMGPLANPLYATALIGADSWGWAIPGLIDEVRISDVQREFTGGEDTIPPDTIIETGPAEMETICSDSPTFTWQGTDDQTPGNQLLFRWRMDGPAWSEPSAETSHTFSGLFAGIHIFEVAAQDMAGNWDPTPAGRTFTVDTAPPSVLAVNAAPETSRCVITWTTDRPATSQVEYGLTASYGSLTPLVGTPSTSHSVTLTDLNPYTTYHFRVLSRDACDREASSADGIFATLQGITYYGYNPNTSGALRLVGFSDNTNYSVVNLDATPPAVFTSGSLNRGASTSVGIPNLRHFKVDAGKALFVYLGYDCCSFGGSFFYPANDGINRVGTDFTLLIPVLSGTNEFIIWAYDAADVTVRRADGSVVTGPIHLASAQRWSTTGSPLAAGTLYYIQSVAPGSDPSSPARIALQSNTGNGNAAVPSRNGRDMGTDFLFSTHNWGGGAMAIFAYKDTDVTCTNLNSGAALFTVHLNRGQTYYRGSTGRTPYRLTTTADVAVWAGDLEGGGSIADMGDDITINQGNGGREFFLHSQTQGAKIFCGYDNTVVSVTNVGTGATTDYSRNRDGFIDIAAGQVLQIVASNPVMVETLGGNGFNDWGNVLNPVFTLDTECPFPPVAVPAVNGLTEPDRAVVVGRPVTFDASASTGDIISYQWDFDGNGSPDSTDVIATYAYNALTPPGSPIHVTLTVADAEGCQSTTVVRITVRDEIPFDLGIAEMDMSVTPASPLHGVARIEATLHNDSDFDGTADVHFTASDGVNNIEIGTVAGVAVAQQSRAVVSIDHDTTPLDGTFSYTATIVNAAPAESSTANNAATIFGIVIDNTPPHVASYVPVGEVHSAVDHIDVTFSEEMHPFDAGVLTLTGPAGGIAVSPAPLSGSVWRISFAAQAAPGDYVLTVGPGLNDLAFNAMSPTSYTGGFTISLPNLAASCSAPPAAIDAGGMLSLAYQVTNATEIVATGTWQDCLYLSSDDQPGNDILLACADRAGPLAAQGSYDNTISAAVPSLPGGPYWIILKVNDGWSILEQDQTDNLAVVGPTELRVPDLEISEVTGPQEGWTGQAVDVSWRVTNIAQASATASWQDCVWLSSDAFPGDDQQLVCLDRPIPLPAGAHYDRTVSVSIPAVSDGEYWIIVETNVGHVLWEGDATNNTFVLGPISVHVTPCPNLVPSAPVIANTDVVGGGKAFVDFSVTNIGTGATNVPFWYDRLYLSADQTLGSGDTAITPDFASQMALNPGESYAQAVQFTVPNNLLGDYYVIVKTDARGQMAECDENDNTAVSAHRLSIRAASLPAILSVVNVAVSDANPWAGDPLTVSWKFTNTGELPSGPFSFDHAIVLSRDARLDYPGDQVLVWHVRAISVSNLDAGQSSQTFSVEVALPNWIGGQYHIIVWPDPPRWCPLSKNPGSTPIEVYQGLVADLVVEQLVAPAGGSSGQPLSVAWRTRNAANDTTMATAWNDAVILSRDADMGTSADNVTLGTYHWSGGRLAFDESYPVSLNVLLPDDGDGDYTLFVCADVNDVLYEGTHNDNNCASQPVNVSYRPPDLQVAEVQVLVNGNPPGQVLSGTPVTVQWQVDNTGTGPTGVSAWQDRLYLSADENLDGADMPLALIDHVGTLANGQSYIAQREVVIPVTFQSPVGYLFVCTDHGNVVYESADNNNCGRQQTALEVVWGPADLSVSDAAVLVGGQPVTSLAGGSVATVQWQVHNAGPGATALANWKDRIVLSSDGVLDANDVELALASHSGVLAAGEDYSPWATRNVQIPVSFPAGGAHLFICADSQNVIYESDEANNCRDISLNIGYGGSDLVVTGVTLLVNAAPLAGPVPAGSDVTVQWQVRNQGPGSTVVGKWQDAVRLSLDETLDGQDPTLGELEHDGVLNAGESYSASRTVRIPANAVGETVYVFVCADVLDAVFEQDNGNCMPAAPITTVWGLPDLVMAAATASAGQPAGLAVNVNWTVRNDGGPTGTPAEWNDLVYLSNDAQLDAGDALLHVQPHQGPLDHQQTYAVSLANVPVPAGLVGSFHVIIQTDGPLPGGLVETNEGNNEGKSAVPLNVGTCSSNLVVTSVDAPSGGFSGQTATINWRVVNQGLETTYHGSWRDVLYLSRDQYLDRDADTYLGYLQHNGALAAGTGYDAQLEARIPAGLSGPYYVFVIADGGSALCEQNEGDNAAFDGTAMVVTLAPPADLVVSEITAPGSAVLGESITLQWAVANNGSFQAEGSWHDSLYLSADAVWDLGDPKIGTVQHTGTVAPGTPYGGTITAAVPGAIPGSYYVLVRTDIFNEVRESEEGNNVGASAGRVEVSVMELTLGIPTTGHFPAAGTSRYYRVHVDPEQTLRITLDAAGSGANEVYVRYGQIPDRGHFDIASEAPFQADQLVVVPTTRAGDYFILVYADVLPGGGGDYTLLAETIPFSISEVLPDRGSNTGQVTLKVLGGRFEPETVFTLLRDPAHPLSPSAYYFRDPARAFVTYDLTGTIPGLSDLAAANPDGAEIVEEQVFEILGGGGAQLRAWILSPGSVRAFLPFMLRIGYTNTGTADMPAPLLELRSSRSMSMSLSPQGPFSTRPIRVLAVNNDGPAGVLPPGGHGTVMVYFEGSGAGSLTQGLIHRGGNEWIDWAAEQARLKPADMSEAKWLLLLDRIKARTGSTYKGLERELAKTATRLWERGETVCDFDRLWAEYLELAENAYPSRVAGALFDVDSSSPLPDTALVLRSTGGVHIITTRTGADGTFEAFVPAGSYEPLLEQRFLEPAVTIAVPPDADVVGLELWTRLLPPDEPPAPLLEIPDNAPRFARDAEGDGHLIWKRGGDLWHARHDGGGWQVSGQVGQVAPIDAWLSAAPANAGPGGVTVVWQEGAGNDSELYYSTGRPSEQGYSWTQGTAVTQDTVSDRSAAVAPVGGDRIMIVYLKRNDAIQDDSDLYYHTAVVDLEGAPLMSPPPISLEAVMSELAAESCLGVEVKKGSQLPGWVPIIGGKHKFEVSLQACYEGGCEPELSGGGGVTVHFGDRFEIEGSVSGSGGFTTDKEKCEYVFNSFELSLEASGTGKIPVYTIPTPRWVKVELGAILTGSASGSVGWEGTGFPAWPNKGKVELGLGGGPYGEAGFGPDPDDPLVSAELSGVITLHAGWEAARGFYFGGWCFTATAEVSAWIFSYEWTGQWGPACTDNSAALFTDVVPGNAVVLRQSRLIAGNIPSEQMLVIRVAPSTGTGSVYPGNPVLADVANDLKNDNPPSLARSTSGETLVAWTKDAPDPNVQLGSAVVVASDTGSGFAAPVTIAGADNFNDAPAVVFDSSGVPMVVWSSASAAGLNLSTPAQSLLDAIDLSDLVYSRRVNGVWSAPAPLPPLGGTDLSVALAAGEDGNVLAAWINLNKATGIAQPYAAIWDGAGWSEPALVSSGTGRCLRVTCGFVQGSAMAVWSADLDGDVEATPLDQTLYYSTRIGGQWSSPLAMPKAPAPESVTAVVRAARAASMLGTPPDECCAECESDADCDDQKPCTDDVCIDHKCENKPKDCDDHDACTEDTCDSEGQCDHQPLDCDDQNACTIDSCDPQTGCAHEDVSKDNGQWCDGEESCDPVTGEAVPGTPPCPPTTVCDEAVDRCACNQDVDCDDSNACTIDDCGEDGYCNWEQVTCPDDGDPCTREYCDPVGGCLSEPETCDDQNACTQDSCEPGVGCRHETIDCDDHNACTDDGCNAEAGCVHTPVTCPPDTECVHHYCDPATGCQSESNDCCENCPDIRPPVDPNEKTGPAGYGPQAFVGPQQDLPFTIYFENLPEALGWAAEVTITDQLSSYLDWQTFRLGEIAFGDQTVVVPEGRPRHIGDLPMANGLTARIRATINIESGTATWIITAIDPATGEMVQDPTTGLLPPNNPQVHDGEGHVTFTIRTLPDVATGTRFENRSTIVFDRNEPIDTNQVAYTVDSDAPISAVAALPAATAQADIPLQWSGDDPPGGAGLAGFTIYVSTDNGPFVPLVSGTADTQTTYHGAAGHVYSFYSIARDHVGNEETPPAVPDATIMVVKAPEVLAWEIGCIHADAVGKLYTVIHDGWVEPRTAGITELRVTFDQPMAPASVSTEQVQLVNGAGADVSPLVTTAALDPAGTMLTITLAPALPDADTYRVVLGGGILSVAGLPILGDYDLCVTALAGDANGDKSVTAEDSLAVKAHNRETLTEANAKYDVNCSGAINSQDQLAVKARIGHTAPACPAALAPGGAAPGDDENSGSENDPSPPATPGDSVEASETSGDGTAPVPSKPDDDADRDSGSSPPRVISPPTPSAQSTSRSFRHSSQPPRQDSPDQSANAPVARDLQDEGPETGDPAGDEAATSAPMVPPCGSGAATSAALACLALGLMQIGVRRNRLTRSGRKR